MHTGGHFDFGAYALRNNGNLLNYVKTKAKGVLEVEMLLAKGTKISKHYFPHDSCPVEFFKKVRTALDSPQAVQALNKVRSVESKFEFEFNGINTKLIVNVNNKIISCFPII